MITMTNDTTTLNGSLMEIGETMADNLTSMGVEADAEDGLTTLSNKVLDIEPSIAGIELTTSIELGSNTVFVGDDLTLKLKAEYDDETVTNTDLQGVLTGATILFKENNTTIKSGTTNSNGVLTTSFNNADIYHTYQILFEGTTYFSQCSANITVTPSYDSINISTNKSALSYDDGESVTITAQLKNGTSNDTTSGVILTFKNGNNTLGTATTNNGVATFTYNSSGIGDVNITADDGYFTSNSILIEDCIKYGINNWSGSYNSGTDTYAYISPKSGTQMYPNVQLPRKFMISFKFKDNNSSSATSGNGLWLIEDQVGGSSTDGTVIGTLSSNNRLRISDRTDGTLTTLMYQNATYSYQTWTDAVIYCDGDVVSMTVGGKTVSAPLNVDTETLMIVMYNTTYTNFRVADFKIKAIDEVPEGTFTELAGLASRNSGTDVYLNRNYKNTDNYQEQGITLSANRNIYGNGYIIDCNNIGRAFYMNTESVNLGVNDLTIKNGYHSTQSGGAIYNNKGILTVNNCNFINNHPITSKNGGAIAVGSNSNGATITGCTFNGNSANNGGAIYNNKSALIEECIFGNIEVNTAITNGGDICSTNPLTVYNCTMDISNSYNVTNVSD